jgi:uncharacterized protein YbjT (DUF2867 family)
MDKPILVTGGTGTLGRLVVARLREAGRDVRVLNRRGGGAEADANVEYLTGDLATGAGVEGAVEGIEVIVHCAGARVGDDATTQNLVGAASRAGARHLVYISVVGADRIPVQSRIDRAMFGYFGSKLAAEQVVAGSGIPWTTLRATQFQQSFLSVARGMAKLPVIPVPRGFRFQPIDAREVATRLTELALGGPAGLVTEVGGPQVLGMGDLIRIYLQATHRRRLMLPVPTMGGAATAFRAGANLTPDRVAGRSTWEDFVAERVGPAGEMSPGPA